MIKITEQYGRPHFLRYICYYIIRLSSNSNNCSEKLNILYFIWFLQMTSNFNYEELFKLQYLYSSGEFWWMCRDYFFFFNLHKVFFILFFF